MTDFIRLLLIEDDEGDAELIRWELEQDGFGLDCRRVDNEQQLRSSIAQGDWDVIVSDFAMPGFDGLRAFQIAQELRSNVPFIFVSGALGEERAVEAMRAGARDYLLKDNLSRLSAAVRRELMASETSRSERRLRLDSRREQRRLGAAVEASGAGIFEIRTTGSQPPHISPRLRQILGLRPADVPSGSGALSWAQGLLHPEEFDLALEASRSFVDGAADRFSIESRIRQADGNWVDVAIYAKALARDERRRPLHLVGVVMDLTERRALENQLRQAQKMEAVGRLAGGVAHDFNNLLTAVFSFARFALDQLEPESSPYQDIQEALKAAERARVLTTQLLAFSRRRPLAAKVVNVNEVIRDVKRMLSRLVGEDVVVDARLGRDVSRTRIDPGSLEQVVVNLAINARDAMPKGGRLTIKTSDTFIDEGARDGSIPPLKAGNYVCVTVSDEGVGMDQATMAQIFEPFFTTKDVGSGTGLGLSTCYGIINQAGGGITVESAVGKGSTFRIVLPTTTDAEEARSVKVSRSAGGTETVLVVEDEEPLRRLTVRALSALGYKVFSASNGAEAFSLFEDGPDQIDLLLIDVVMPKLGGKDVVERFSKTNFGGKVLFMSGYAPDVVAAQGISGVGMLEKPFTPEMLGASVRRALDS